MRIYFPMAGQGARFGHKFKPFLTIGNELFIEAAVQPFRAFKNEIEEFVFVYLESQEREFEVTARLTRVFHDLPHTSVHLATPTRGPAETIGAAVEQRGFQGRAFVCDCDHALDVGPLFAEAAYDVLLPVWPLDPNELASWSVATVTNGRVTAIAEKRMPDGADGTPMGVIGCYGFRDIADIARRAHAQAATNFSDVIARMLAERAMVRAATIRSARFFGDPTRLARAEGESK